MFVDEAGKNFDDFGAVLEAFDHSEHITDGGGKMFHGRFGGIEGSIEFTQCVGHFFDEKNDLDANDGGNNGKNRNGEEADDLGQGHGFSIPKLLREDGEGNYFGGGTRETVDNGNLDVASAWGEVELSLEMAGRIWDKSQIVINNHGGAGRSKTLKDNG